MFASKKDLYSDHWDLYHGLLNVSLLLLFAQIKPQAVFKAAKFFCVEYSSF